MRLLSLKRAHAITRVDLERACADGVSGKVKAADAAAAVTVAERAAAAATAALSTAKRDAGAAAASAQRDIARQTTLLTSRQVGLIYITLASVQSLPAFFVHSFLASPFNSHHARFYHLLPALFVLLFLASPGRFNAHHDRFCPIIYTRY
jgi:hypothetical protein